MGQPLPADTRARRAALVSRNSHMFGSLKEFVLEYAPGLFGGVRPLLSPPHLHTHTHRTARRGGPS